MENPPVVDEVILGQLRTIGGEALVKRLVTLFFESSKGYISEIQEGSLAGDLGRVETAAHTLKSGAGSLGARAVHELAGRVELASREGDSEATQSLIEELMAAYEAACEELGSAIE